MFFKERYSDKKRTISSRYLLILLLVILSAFISGCIPEDRFNIFDERSGNYYGIDSVPKETAWTVMVYAGADNNLEEDILTDIYEMHLGMKGVSGINLIVFIDRSPSWSNDSYILGSNFSGGKLFRITGDKIYELYGQEYLPECMPGNYYNVNSGDAGILKKFVQFSKKYYKADKYALILSSHGGGSRSALPMRSIDGSSTRQIIADDTSFDDIYTAEMSEVLEESESVDLLGYDACLMGAIEVAYQYRPGNGSFSASYMVASPASEWTPGWDFTAIFQRMAGTGENTAETNDVFTEGQGTYEKYFDPASMTAKEFGGIIVEEFHDQFVPAISGWDNSETLSLYDLAYAGSVKSAVDNLVDAIDKDDDKDGISALGVNRISWTSSVIHYYQNWYEAIAYPYHDLYDLAAAIEADPGNNISDLTVPAGELMDAIEPFIVLSFAGSYYNDMSPVYSSFQNGLHGVHIYFPHDYDFEGEGIWYSPLPVISAHGKLAWCDEGASPNGTVENWFELLDYWYDSVIDTNSYEP